MQAVIGRNQAIADVGPLAPSGWNKIVAANISFAMSYHAAAGFAEHPDSPGSIVSHVIHRGDDTCNFVS